MYPERIGCLLNVSAKLGRFSLAKPRNTLVSAVSSFTPACRCLLGVADGLAAPSQLKCHGNAMVDGFVYFAASGGDAFSSGRPPAEMVSTGKTGWKYSCVDSTMGEMAAYIHGNQGVLAERLAEHETLL